LTLGAFIARFAHWPFGVAFGVTAGVLSGVIGAIPSSAALGIMSGAALAAGLNVWKNGPAYQIPWVSPGVSLGAAVVLGGSTLLMLQSKSFFGPPLSLPHLTAFLLAFGFAAIATSTALPVYPLSAGLQIALYVLESFGKVHTLSFVPALHHELIYVPLPFLGRHILLNAEAHPELARASLQACSLAPGLRQTGRKVLAELQARELSTLAKTFYFSEIANLQGTWLPGVQGAEPVMLAFQETARYLQAARNTPIPHHSLEHLKRARSGLEALGNQLLASQSWERYRLWWKPFQPTKYQRLNEAVAFLLMFLGLFALFSLVSYNSRDPAYNSSLDPLRSTNLVGYAGAYFSRWILHSFGITAFAAPAIVWWLAWKWVRSEPIVAPVTTALGIVLLVLGTWTTLSFGPQWVFYDGIVPVAGQVGLAIGGFLNNALNVTGAVMADVMLLVSGALLAVSFKTQNFFRRKVFQRSSNGWSVAPPLRWLRGSSDRRDRELPDQQSQAGIPERLQTNYSRRTTLRELRRPGRATGTATRASENSVKTNILPRHLVGTLRIWLEIVADLEREAETAASAQLPNPFRAGEPLGPDRGKAVFKGRDNLIRQINSLLALPNESCSIALLGPHKCGKTSLLRMLPELLPDAVCIFFDLQDNPVHSPIAFFEALCRQSQDQALRDRRIKVPPLPPGPPFESASEWFQALDSLEGDHRVMICIDEFHLLEKLFPGSERELLQLMGLLRATIQHRRRLRLLVSGTAPFDELGRLWNDHFINVREMRIGPLDRETSFNLLTSPIPEFSTEVVPPALAESIFDRTGGQPYLLQLFGSILITRLNDERRRTASLDDLPRVEEEALIQGGPFFRDAYYDAPSNAKIALESLAIGRSPDLDNRTRSWLRRRCLLTDNDRLALPLLGTFILGEIGK